MPNYDDLLDRMVGVLEYGGDTYYWVGDRWIGESEDIVMFLNAATRDIATPGGYVFQQGRAVAQAVADKIGGINMTPEPESKDQVPEGALE